MPKHHEIIFHPHQLLLADEVAPSGWGMLDRELHQPVEFTDTTRPASGEVAVLPVTLPPQNAATPPALDDLPSGERLLARTLGFWRYQAWRTFGLSRRVA